MNNALMLNHIINSYQLRLLLHANYRHLAIFLSIKKTSFIFLLLFVRLSTQKNVRFYNTSRLRMKLFFIYTFFCFAALVWGDVHVVKYWNLKSKLNTTTWGGGVVTYWQTRKEFTFWMINDEFDSIPFSMLVWLQKRVEKSLKISSMSIIICCEFLSHFTITRSYEWSVFECLSDVSQEVSSSLCCVWNIFSFITKLYFLLCSDELID